MIQLCLNNNPLYQIKQIYFAILNKLISLVFLIGYSSSQPNNCHLFCIVKKMSLILLRLLQYVTRSHSSKHSQSKVKQHIISIIIIPKYTRLKMKPNVAQGLHIIYDDND